MAQMIRKQVYIEPLQDEFIKKCAQSLGITEAEVIRRAIDGQLASLPSGVRDLSAWAREKSFISGRMSVCSGPGGRKFNREDAYMDRLRRRGR